MTRTLQGAGLGYRRDLADDFLNLPANSPIAFIEAAPENWLKMGGAARKRFDEAAERLPLALHGLSLSLGGQAPLDTELLAGIKDITKPNFSTPWRRKPTAASIWTSTTSM